MEYRVFKDGKEIGEGTLTECIEHVATQVNQFHPEQVTVKDAVEAGFQFARV